MIDRLLMCRQIFLTLSHALTPAHLIYDRRIVSVPHPVEDLSENADPSYLSDKDMRKATSRHTKLTQQFWVRWRKEQRSVSSTRLQAITDR